MGMLYLGSIYGGPEVARSTIARVLTKIYVLRGEGAEGPDGSLDVVVHTSCSMLRLPEQQRPTGDSVSGSRWFHRRHVGSASGSSGRTIDRPRKARRR